MSTRTARAPGEGTIRLRVLLRQRRGQPLGRLVKRVASSSL
jgi:hypothetical protein